MARRGGAGRGLGCAATTPTRLRRRWRAPAAPRQFVGTALSLAQGCWWAERAERLRRPWRAAHPATTARPNAPLQAKAKGGSCSDCTWDGKYYMAPYKCLKANRECSSARGLALPRKTHGASRLCPPRPPSTPLRSQMHVRGVPPGLCVLLAQEGPLQVLQQAALRGKGPLGLQLVPV